MHFAFGKHFVVGEGSLTIWESNIENLKRYKKSLLLLSKIYKSFNNKIFVGTAE